MNIIRVSEGLDPDQDQLSVGPDLGPNFLQRLSTDNTLVDKSYKSYSVILYLGLGGGGYLVQAFALCLYSKYQTPRL